MLPASGQVDLAPTLGPLVRSGSETVKSALQRVADSGFADVQLDATLSGIRPRELDQRARRDLLAMANRLGLRPAGLDCFVPPTHLLHGEHLDRAVSALTAAVTLAADLGRLKLSFALPTLAEASREAIDAIVESADAHAVPLALHAEQGLDGLRSLIESIGSPSVRIGIDTASCLIAGIEPTAAATADTASLRLADAQRDRDRQWQRVAVGHGELDVTAARLAAELTPRDGQPVILDLGRVDAPASAMRLGLDAWRSHAPELP